MSLHLQVIEVFHFHIVHFWCRKIRGWGYSKILLRLNPCTIRSGIVSQCSGDKENHDVLQRWNSCKIHALFNLDLSQRDNLSWDVINLSGTTSMTSLVMRAVCSNLKCECWSRVTRPAGDIVMRPENSLYSRLMLCIGIRTVVNQLFIYPFWRCCVAGTSVYSISAKLVFK